MGFRWTVETAEPTYRPMSTRSGRSYKPTMTSPSHVAVIPAVDDPIDPLAERTTDPGTHHTEDAASPTMTTPTSGDVAMILDVMRTMMVDREKREMKLAEERRRQEAERAQERERQEALRKEDRRRHGEESERHISAMHRQMEMLQELVRGQTEEKAKRDTDPIKLTRLADSDDIESYLTTFERMMKAYEVDNARWAF